MPYKLKKDKAKHDKEYNAKPSSIVDRMGRNFARNLLEEAGKVHQGDGKDVHHKDGNPRNNSKSNLAVASHKQRGIKKA